MLRDVGAALNAHSPIPPITEGPLRVIVPSSGLRVHFLHRLLQAEGRPVLGLTCYTLHRTAEMILQQAGESTQTHNDLIRLLARRAAQGESALRKSLDSLVDGYSTALGALVDFFDAGFDPAHQEAIEELLQSEGSRVASRSELGRAHALTRVAAETLEQARSLGLQRSSDLLSRAAAVVRGRGAEVFSCGHLFVYGFADATGTAADLLEALLETFNGRFYLDLPQDPGVRFTERIQQRLGSRGQVEPCATQATPPNVSGFRALGAEAEMHRVATSIQELLGQGVEPEGIAIVARRLEGSGSLLRRHLGRLGIPFSGELTVPNARLPTVQALLAVMKRRCQVSVERWLAAWRGLDRATAHDLLLGLSRLGAARLEEVAALKLKDLVPGDSLPLSVRQGFGHPEDNEDDGGRHRLYRRRIPRRLLELAVSRASSLTRNLRRLEKRQPLADQLPALVILLVEGLEWNPDDALTGDLLAALEAAARGAPADLPLDLTELTQLLEEPALKLGHEPLGGAGSGVQVLSVTEARSRTFDHLFVIGMNRGVFPRPVREDPLLSDDLRRLLVMHGLLPDLAIKSRGVHEERYLFAQLLSAGERVHLSWLEVSDENQPQTASPLVERLRHSSTIELKPTPDRRADGPRPALEHAIEAGLAGSSAKEWARIAACALPESPDPQLVATARAAIWTEYELRQAGTQPTPPGPYFGFVGPAVDALDPRRSADLWITHLEALARCPWQTFLSKLLRLEPLPDPWESLPSFSPKLKGSFVHKVLEQIGGDRPERPQTFDRALLVPPQKLTWPAGDELLALSQRVAEILCRAEGIALPGFAAALARIAAPYLQQAQTRDETVDTELLNLGFEVEGIVQHQMASGEPRQIRFRIDRLDRSAEGLVATDYKTGKKPPPKSDLLAETIAAGKFLQASAYARLAEVGRYLFLHPDYDESKADRELRVHQEEETLHHSFRFALDRLLAAWEQGAFFPRLTEPTVNKTPTACTFCEVAEACVQKDSTSRRRLFHWATAAPDDEAPNRPAAQDAALRLWHLGAKEGVS